MLNYILFDNDGILVDTERYYYQASHDVLAKIGLELTPELFNDFSLTRGVGVWEAFKSELSDQEVLKLRNERDERYQKLLSTEPLLVDGIEEVLQELVPKYKLAIITTSMPNDFVTIHGRTGLLRHFDFYLANGDYRRSKPAPDPYLAGIAKMGLPPSEGIVIEDTLRGVRSAKKAGLPVVAIPNSFNKYDDFSEADYKLTSIQKLPDLLQNIS